MDELEQQANSSLAKVIDFRKQLKVNILKSSQKQLKIKSTQSKIKNMRTVL
jgi:hypothetical protein